MLLLDFIIIILRIAALIGIPDIILWYLNKFIHIEIDRKMAGNLHADMFSEKLKIWPKINIL